VSCENCEDAKTSDGIQPDCETEEGCKIPPLGPDERRLIEIHEKLVALRDLVGPEIIMQAYEVTKEDMDMLALIEATIKEVSPKPEGGQNG
jgi:hypothetical protein